MIALASDHRGVFAFEELRRRVVLEQGQPLRREVQRGIEGRVFSQLAALGRLRKVEGVTDGDLVALADLFQLQPDGYFAGFAVIDDACRNVRERLADLLREDAGIE